MNKTLLLIIIDFLFLNLIALTRWEKAEPTRARQAPVPAMAGGGSAQPRDQDLVELMRVSMEDERSTRNQMAADLQTAQKELQVRSQDITQLEASKAQLQSSLAATEKDVRDLSQKVAAATQDAALTKEQLSRLQRELENRQAEAARQARELTAFQQQQDDSKRQIDGLNVAVKVAEREKALLQASLLEAKQQAEAERQERQKLLAQTNQLAAGVGRLAETSGDLAQQIRDNQPLNANALFNDFLANRVSTTLTASRKVLIGSGARTKQIKTVLITDGRSTYALAHAGDTPFPVVVNGVPVDWERISGEFSHAPVSLPIAKLQFLALDPRIVVIPLDAGAPARLGVKPYRISLEPFKYTEAMLVSNGGAGYGETSFRIDSETPNYVRMDNRLIKHLFGEFTPSAGDLVFSKTGELLGIMVNSDYCAVLSSFQPAQVLRTGENTLDQHTSAVLADLAARLQGLPLRLQ